MNGPPAGHQPQARLEQAAERQAAEESKPKIVFVFENDKPWQAWKAYKEHKLGRKWNLVTTAIIEGRHRRGWWFPTLYPPRESTGPPNSGSLMTAADEEELAKGI